VTFRGSGAADGNIEQLLACLIGENNDAVPPRRQPSRHLVEALQVAAIERRERGKTAEYFLSTGELLVDDECQRMHGLAYRLLIRRLLLAIDVIASPQSEEH
jgi:hypothetical protein